jgi:hypothetical protein
MAKKIASIAAGYKNFWNSNISHELIRRASVLVFSKLPH